MRPRPPRSALCPYTTLFRSERRDHRTANVRGDRAHRFRVRFGGNGEPGLDDVRAELRNLTGQLQLLVDAHRDRKSTRLNSSHANISYAVFCLKKNTRQYLVP